MKRTRALKQGFTLLEVMVAIFIFSLVITAIYSTWMTIVKGYTVGLKVSAAVQRSRIAMNALEAAFTTSTMYSANIKHYLFFADTSGDMAELSMVSRLPAGFPGVERFGDAVVRRITFRVQRGAEGNELIMTQAPMLQDTNAFKAEPYSLVLAKDVTLFRMQFLDPETGEWVEEWSFTNKMPRMVEIALGLGRSASGATSDPQDLNVRLVAIPSAAVHGDSQGAGFPAGLPGPGGLTPGVDPATGLPIQGQPMIDPATGRLIRNPNDVRNRDLRNRGRNR